MGGNLEKGVLCYELFGGIAHKNRAFFIIEYFYVIQHSEYVVIYLILCLASLVMDELR